MSNLDVLNLTGVYNVDPRSESLEEILKIQGMGWAIRKLAAKVSNSIVLTIDHTSDKLTQSFSTPVKNKVIEIDLNASETVMYDAEVKANITVTVLFEDNGKKIIVKAIVPKRFERITTWQRVDENTIHCIASVTTTDGSNQKATVNRYYTLRK